MPRARCRGCRLMSYRFDEVQGHGRVVAEVFRTRDQVVRRLGMEQGQPLVEPPRIQEARPDQPISSRPRSCDGRAQPRGGPALIFCQEGDSGARRLARAANSTLGWSSNETGIARGCARRIWFEDRHLGGPRTWKSERVRVSLSADRRCAEPMRGAWRFRRHLLESEAGRFP